MSSENKELLRFLQELNSQQTFKVALTPRLNNSTVYVPEVECVPLTTSQLKKLIETVVDSPITQSVFNSTATEIFKSCSKLLPEDVNVIDRLLFLIETRINSLSPSANYKEDDKEYAVDFREIKEQLQKTLNEHYVSLAPSLAQEGQIIVRYQLPLLESESRLNEEVYKKIKIKVDDMEEFRKILGEAFIHEIAKVITSVEVGQQTVTFNNLSFAERIKIVENLPSSLIQHVIEFIEKYKKIIDDALKVNDYLITIDGSLFSIR